MTGLLRLVALNGRRAPRLRYPRRDRGGARASDRRRAGPSPATLAPGRLLVAWAATPVGIATALVGLALWPSVGAVLGLAVDHCPEHAGHVHLCLHHLPVRGPSLVGALSLVGFTAIAGSALVRGVRSASLTACLACTPSFELALGVGIVESSRPFALTVGWFRLRVLVSSALVERLTPAQLDVVVEHERAHAVRRDALAVTAARVLALAHLPAVRRRILADLTLGLRAGVRRGGRARVRRSRARRGDHRGRGERRRFGWALPRGGTCLRQWRGRAPCRVPPRRAH